MNQTDVLGRWTIITWCQRFDNGTVTFPMGERPAGFIAYGADGFMTCFICRADRQPFLTGGQWDASPAERSRAYGEVLAYAGRFNVMDDHIEHNVELSLFPNWVGGRQLRQAVLVDGRLLLTARLEEGSAYARTSELEWHRDTPNS